MPHSVSHPRRQAFLESLATAAPSAMLDGLPLVALPLETLATRLVAWLEEADGPLHVVTLNPEIVQRALAEPELYRLIQSAEIIVADGVGIQWAIRQRTGRTIPKVPGVDLARRILELSAARGWEVFLLGGAPGIAATAAERLTAAIPELNIIGTDHGYHRDTPEDPKDATRVVNTLIALQPDILLVGMGSPKQEALIAELKGPLGKALLIGVGGSLDVWAGAVVRAPRVFVALHCEWLWRMLLQPARLRRFPVLLQFAWRVWRG